MQQPVFKRATCFAIFFYMLPELSRIAVMRIIHGGNSILFFSEGCNYFFFESMCVFICEKTSSTDPEPLIGL